MSKKIIYAVLVAFLLSSCLSDNRIVFYNSLDIERIDEAIVITKNELASKIRLKQGMWPVFSYEGQLIPTQADDLDGDGKWDEITLMADFLPKEEKTLEVDFFHPSQYPKFTKRTNLRLGILQKDGTYKEVDKYSAPRCDDGFEVIAQAEGVTWENDKMGFRVYFDCRNVKDLFGKLKPEMIADKAGTPELGSYHVLADWGMDILHCGSSLGAGGLALFCNDSLIRLGSTEVYEYQKIIEGPLRSVFELRYQGWHIGNGRQLEAVERISLYPGKYWFRSDVTVSGAPEESLIATGIVTTFLKKQPFEFNHSGFTCLGTHDRQSLNDDELGMAVLVSQEEAGKAGRTSDIDYFKLGFQTVEEKNFSNVISETCYLPQKFTNGKPARHYFFAAWGLERDDWKTAEGFQAYIKSEARKLSERIRIY